MYCAVYTNGAIDMKLTFEMLHHSSKYILFFVRITDFMSCRYYHLLNIKGEISPLELNGCKLISIIHKHSTTPAVIAFELELPDRGVEIIDVYEYPNFYFPPLSISASLIKHINIIGIKEFLRLE
jgi:hypothetical protein